MDLTATKTREAHSERREYLLEKAFIAREAIQSWPNYTPFRICELVKTLGIELEDEDIPVFVNCFDYAHHKGWPAGYAYHAYADLGLTTEEYRKDTYVCRNNMVNGFVLKEVRDNMVFHSFDFVNYHELYVRNYDDLGLIDGTIYPVLHEDFIPLMMLMDKWRNELLEESPESVHANGDVLVPLDNCLVNGADWQIEFRPYKQTHFYDPNHNHAQEALRIIRGIHPDMERFFGKADD